MMTDGVLRDLDGEPIVQPPDVLTAADFLELAERIRASTTRPRRTGEPKPRTVRQGTINRYCNRLLTKDFIVYATLPTIQDAEAFRDLPPTARTATRQQAQHELRGIRRSRTPPVVLLFAQLASLVPVWVAETLVTLFPGRAIPPKRDLLADLDAEYAHRALDLEIEEDRQLEAADAQEAAGRFGGLHAVFIRF
jgi:hypothetical protein